MGIFDEANSVGGRNAGNPRHVCPLTVQMHHDRRTCLPAGAAQPFGEGFRCDEPGVGIAVHEHDSCACIVRPIGRGDKGHGGREHGVFWPEIERHGRKMQRGGAIGARYRLSRAEPPGECLFEFIDFRTRRQHGSMQGSNHRRLVGLGDGLFSIGKKRGLHLGSRKWWALCFRNCHCGQARHFS